MTINYDLTGPKRKELAQAVAEATGAKATYKGAPTFAYEVGDFVITREGTLEAPDEMDYGELQKVLDVISKAGFEFKEETNGLTISIPLDKVKVGNLTKILDAKGGLIKKALGIDDLPIVVTEDEVSFPWFNEIPDPDEITAYTRFIVELCRMSRERNRITATAKDVENEKYAFRCFLLKLGFIGDRYKMDRKILMRNLSGSAAFKGAQRNEIRG